MLYPAMALLGISVGGFATTSALCSQVVPHSLIGEAQGVLASMKSLMEGVGPLAFAWMLPQFEDTRLPGAPWLISAASMAIAFILCLWLEACTSQEMHTHRGRSCCNCSDDEHVSSPLVAPACNKQGRISSSRDSRVVHAAMELSKASSDDDEDISHTDRDKPNHV